MNRTARGILWMTGAALFFSLLIVSARRVAHLPAIEIVLLQSAITTLCMTPWLIRAGTGALAGGPMTIHWLRSAASVAGMVTMFYALRHMNAADATALLFTTVLFTVLLAAALLRERLGWRRAAAVGVGFLGAMIVIRPGFQENSWPALAMLFVGLAFAGVNVATRFFAGTQNPNAVVLTLFGLMAVLAAPPAALVWRMPGTEDVPWLIALGVSSALAQQCITRSFAHAPTAAVMPAYFLQLPFAAAIGYAGFREAPDIWVWPGAAIICAAIFQALRTDGAPRRGDAAR